MDFKEFLHGIDRIDFIEVITFPHLQPDFVILNGPEGIATQLAAKMLDIAERLEVGVLVSWEKENSGKGGRTETFPGGRVLAVEYLAAPGFDFVSGVRIQLDIGDLLITAGDMPYSIFMSLGDIQRGRPEYPIDEYRSISVA